MGFFNNFDYLMNSDKNFTNIGLSAFCKDRGLPKSPESVGKYRKGERTPDPEFITIAADYLNVHEQDFFDRKIANSSIPSQIKQIHISDGYVGAGSYGNSGLNDYVDEAYIDINLIDKAYRSKKIEGLHVSGNSMTPYVNPDDIVLYFRMEKGVDSLSDGIYIIETPQGRQVKNLKFLINGNVRIISENPTYHNKEGFDEEITKETQEYFDIIGKVVGRILKG